MWSHIFDNEQQFSICRRHGGKRKEERMGERQNLENRQNSLILKIMRYSYKISLTGNYLENFKQLSLN